MSEETTGLSLETQGLLCGVLARHPQVETAVLYGSRAKGNFKPGSDIDLTLTGEGLQFDDLLEIADEFDDLPIPHTVDVSIRDRIDNPALREHIRRVGIGLYRREESRERIPGFAPGARA